jgi:hypothetical protein
MKAEVEVSELLALRDNLKAAEQELKEVKSQLAKFDKEAIDAEVLSLAWGMWNSYMVRVSKELGMEWDNFANGESFYGLNHWIRGENPWDSPRLTVNPGVSISKEWQAMFVNLGIKREINPNP